MREENTSKIILALGLLSIAAALLPSTVSAGQSDDKDTLVQDIGNYLAQCKPPDLSPPALTAQQCANQKDELIGRQKSLHLSNTEINKLLDMVTANTRGGSRNVWP